LIPSMHNFNKTIRILIVEDDDEDFFITSSLIKSIPDWNFQTDWCFKYDEALDHVCKKNYDLYFVDYFLGAKTGLDLLKEAVQLDCDVPFILLTGKGNYSVDLEAMQYGAADYLIKDELTTEILERSIRYAIEKAHNTKILRESEHKYRGIFEHSRDAVFLTDHDLNFTTINPATIDLLGYSHDELLRLSLYELIADKELVSSIKKQIEQKTAINDMEIALIPKNGEEIICIFSAVSMSSSQHHFVQAILHDITKLRSAEKSLITSEKLAAVGRIATTLAHEIRNPLTNIGLSLEFLEKQSVSEEQVSYFEIISRNTVRINETITELLNSARPISINLKKENLQEILENSINIARDRIVLKNIQLEVHYPEHEVYINADFTKMKVALLNIIINAIEAIQQDGRLSISVRLQHPNCEIKIVDNGIGMSKDSLKWLFEPYFTSKVNGIGLGLATTLNILQGHGARIDVDSVEGRGTTFSVRMPVMDESQESTGN
jgi:two-component system, sporulation sensor kinase E